MQFGPFPAPARILDRQIRRIVAPASDLQLLGDGGWGCIDGALQTLALLATARAASGDDVRTLLRGRSASGTRTLVHTLAATRHLPFSPALVHVESLPGLALGADAGRQHATAALEWRLRRQASLLVVLEEAGVLPMHVHVPCAAPGETTPAFATPRLVMGATLAPHLEIAPGVITAVRGASDSALLIGAYDTGRMATLRALVEITTMLRAAGLVDQTMEAARVAPTPEDR